MNETISRMRESGVVAVLRGVDASDVEAVGDALREGGVTAMEVTMGSDDSLAALDALVEHYRGEPVVVGAGTVLDAETARQVQLTGASFVVSPTFDEGVVETCNRYGIPVAPGVATPTEALSAYEAGADLCKVFPASTYGPGHLSSIRGPLPQIPLMPTGGVGPDNAGAYVEAGAEMVGAGGALVPDDALERQDWDEITARAEELVGVVEDAR
ncbi:bifunctional 4-hydroxy-2-oxoglutarate aldolase/2-dehydro-3-deoxy-phosphogluconate aldolase [Halorubellus sp. PRR65]|uniref:bifunctional 4-hydroxy-2-oxoglutarate aldolase/2-dehydro-3-deoxy-phosphogluconate aldolase n=1 Tax=Halorubellus sp. PRR65 TaxID=3098148 RepID=UPI002B25DAF4|nr:bifunctional 4-hydroxy-2-oxoglutarate aldolase/2-dehydro-3-deoxy-phosphogluconate aldolase [Halorubellus sp. PRR65]